MATLWFGRSLSKEIICGRNQKGKKLVIARRDRKKIIKNKLLGVAGVKGGGGLGGGLGGRAWGAKFTLVEQQLFAGDLHDSY